MRNNWRKEMHSYGQKRGSDLGPFRKINSLNECTDGNQMVLDQWLYSVGTGRLDRRAWFVNYYTLWGMNGSAIEDVIQITIESMKIVKMQRCMEFANDRNIIQPWGGTSAEGEPMGLANCTFKLVCSCCRIEETVCEIRTSNSSNWLKRKNAIKSL